MSAEYYYSTLSGAGLVDTLTVRVEVLGEIDLRASEPNSQVLGLLNANTGNLCSELWILLELGLVDRDLALPSETTKLVMLANKRNRVILFALLDHQRTGRHVSTECSATEHCRLGVSSRKQILVLDIHLAELLHDLVTTRHQRIDLRAVLVDDRLNSLVLLDFELTCVRINHTQLGHQFFDFSKNLIVSSHYDHLFLV